MRTCVEVDKTTDGIMVMINLILILIFAVEPTAVVGRALNGTKQCLSIVTISRLITTSSFPAVTCAERFTEDKRIKGVSDTVLYRCNPVATPINIRDNQILLLHQHYCGKLDRQTGRGWYDTNRGVAKSTIC